MKHIIEFIYEALNENTGFKFSHFEKISKEAKLRQIISSSKPNKAENKGFWLFDEAIKKDNNYKKINSGDWHIKYVAAYGKNNGKNEICGLISFSFIYWKEEDKKELKANPIHIFDIQTLSTFKGNNLLKQYFDKLTEIAKANKFDALTLKCYESSLNNVYKNYGFENVKGENNLMIKKL